VVRLSGHRSRGPGFDSRRFLIFWEAVGLERGPLSLVRTTEERLRSRKPRLTTGGSVEVTTQHSLSAKVGTTSPTSGGHSVGRHSSLADQSHWVYFLWVAQSLTWLQIKRLTTNDVRLTHIWLVTIRVLARDPAYFFWGFSWSFSDPPQDAGIGCYVNVWNDCYIKQKFQTIYVGSYTCFITGDVSWLSSSPECMCMLRMSLGCCSFQVRR
jgi:hypothetical protein